MASSIKHTFMLRWVSVGAIALVSLLLFFWLQPAQPSVSMNRSSETPTANNVPTPSTPAVSHLPTPEAVKAVYLTSWVASSPALRNQRVIQLIENTELNAVIIDIKDATGRIAFEVEDPKLQAVGSVQNRIRDVRPFIESLHAKGIYVIARMCAFQDLYYVTVRPEAAVRRVSDGGVWRDRRGQAWVDPGSREVWDYLVALAREAHSVGFDEVNLDYIRFASDGNMKDIRYPLSDGKSKREVMESFFTYFRDHVKDTGVVLSADLFGLTCTVTHDMNIGQHLETAAGIFDYVCPMVYPSHYPYHWEGHARPATTPYPIVKSAMDHAVARLASANISIQKLRPWLQDFNLGAVYTPDMVRAQMQAVYDAGLTSWMLWSPSNIYTKAALKGKS